MVEYAILNASVALKTFAARFTVWAGEINWTVVIAIAGGLLLLRMILGGRRQKI